MADGVYVAQFGEDRELERRFRGRVGFFLDIGAADGVLFSNTHRLEQLGWSGVLIEANPAEADAARSARSASRVVNCAAVAPGTAAEIQFNIAVDNPGLSSVDITPLGRSQIEAWTGRVSVRETVVEARTADSVLEDDPPTQVHVISIDVEGHEHAVLEGLDLKRWRPEVVILERNNRLPDRRVMKRMHAAGYSYEMTTGVNDWFVPGTISMRYRAWLGTTYYLPKLAGGMAARTRRLLRR